MRMVEETSAKYYRKLADLKHSGVIILYCQLVKTLYSAIFGKNDILNYVNWKIRCSLYAKKPYYPEGAHSTWLTFIYEGGGI